MFKKIVAIMLSLSILVSISIPVFAVADVADSTSVYTPENDESEEYVPSNEELARKEALRPHGLEDLYAYTPAATGTNTTVYGPYINIDLMPAVAIGTMLSAIENDIFLYAEYTFGGRANCYKFTHNGITVYVSAEAFRKTQSAHDTMSSSNLSAILSERLTTNNSLPVYTTRIRAENGPNGGYTWYMTQTAYRGFFNSSNEVVVDAEIVGSVYFSVEGTYLTRQGSSADNVKPTFDVRINNPGSGQVFYGGYQVMGKGSNVSVNDIAALIDLGYKSIKIASNIIVSGLTFGTFYSILDTSFALNKWSSGTYKEYMSAIKPISNEAENVYTYSWEFTPPYSLRSATCYHQAVFGLMGTKTSTLDFIVTITYNYS